MLFLYSQFAEPTTLQLFDSTSTTFDLDGCYQTVDMNGNLHSFDDQPAALYSSGTRMWYHHGRRHRDNDLPAIIYADGTKMWYHHGRRHRDNDLPAIVYPNGIEERWVNGSRIK